MTIETPTAPKRRYSPPVLTSYGTMATLTKSGIGSKIENDTTSSRNKRP